MATTITEKTVVSTTKASVISTTAVNQPQERFANTYIKTLSLSKRYVLCISIKDVVEDYESKDHKYKVHKEIHYGPNGKTIFQSSSSMLGSPMTDNGDFGSPFKFPSVFDTPDRMGDIEGTIHFLYQHGSYYIFHVIYDFSFYMRSKGFEMW